MKLTTSFTIIRAALKNKPLDDISCAIDDVEVPIKKYDLELEVNRQEPNFVF